MHLEQFREFFGLLGQGTNPFLSDRIFRLADQDNDGHISMEEFATILDIYQNGSVDEKNEFSFGLFDVQCEGEINFEEMYFVMKKFMSHWNSLQGQTTHVDREALKRIFDTIDVDYNNSISLEEYKQVLRKMPNLFSWFDILSG